MKEREIGFKRTFLRYNGEWKIIKLIKDKNIKFTLILKPHKCPYCGGVYGDKKEYCFNYIEILKNNDKFLHLGVSDDDPGRWVIFEDYLNETQIKEIDNGD